MGKEDEEARKSRYSLEALFIDEELHEAVDVRAFPLQLPVGEYERFS